MKKGMRLAAMVLAAEILLGAAARVGAVTPAFLGLGDLPGGQVASRANGVSHNGQYVVGYSGTSYPEYEAFRWSASTGIVGLGTIPGTYSSFAYNVSDDGNTVSTSTLASGGTCRAGVWRPGTGMTWLGYAVPGDTDGWAFCASADGAVMAGCIEYGSSWTGFRWTQGSGVVNLAPHAGSGTGMRASSSDGSVLAGWFGYDAGVWTEAGGLVSIGRLPGNTYGSAIAYGISADGTVVVGTDGTASSQGAFCWTAGTGIRALGDLAGGQFCSQANAVCADGGTVVGFGENATGKKAVVWQAGQPARLLQDMLTQDYDLSLTGWTLVEATGVSDDGKVIVGWGLNPAGKEEAFIATIPEPACVSLLAAGGLAVLRRRRKS